MPFQKGNKLSVGNIAGRKNKGKTYSSKGSKHPENCQHCLAITTGNNFDRKSWSRKYKRVKRLAKYGLTEDQFQQMFIEQNGVCKICGGSAEGSRWGVLSVDHCHKTGKVRGLLCMTCNTLLGRFEERQDAIMNYLGLI